MTLPPLELRLRRGFPRVAAGFSLPAILFPSSGFPATSNPLRDMTAFFPSDIRKVRPSRRHGAYRAMLKRTGREDSLTARKAAGLPLPLSEDEVRGIVVLLCHRCQPRTRDMVGRYFANLASAQTRWWHERITYEHDRWCYTAGQDCSAEIRGIRAEILRSA